MLNEILEALKTKLEEIAGFNYVLGPEVMVGDVRNVNFPLQILVNPKDLPVLVMDFNQGNIKRPGKRYEHTYKGNILVCVGDVKAELPTEELYDLTFGSSGVYKKLLGEAPVTDSGELIRWSIIGDTFSRTFNETEERQFYVCEVIPVQLIHWEAIV